MAPGGTRRFLILDACVLIDYVDTDPSVLGTVSRHIAPIAVVRPVFDEVEQLDEGEAYRLDIEIVEVDLALAVEASRGTSPLSFEDQLCLLLAKQEGWTCVTNDRRLRKECVSTGVSVLWGLEMMGDAVRAGALTSAEALAVAESIHQVNPRYVTAKILRAFARKLAL